MGTHRAPSECELDGVEVGDGAPHLRNQALLGHVYVAQVQGVVDGLHLPHLDEPDPDVLSRGLQDPLAVILRLIQHLSERRNKGRVLPTPLLQMQMGEGPFFPERVAMELSFPTMEIYIYIFNLQNYKKYEF